MLSPWSVLEIANRGLARTHWSFKSVTRGLILVTTMTEKAAIHTEHLSHAFATDTQELVVVLEDISITLPAGSRTLLVLNHFSTILTV